MGEIFDYSMVGRGIGLNGKFSLFPSDESETVALLSLEKNNQIFAQMEFRRSRNIE